MEPCISNLRGTSAGLTLYWSIPMSGQKRTHMSKCVHQMKRANFHFGKITGIRTKIMFRSQSVMPTLQTNVFLCLVPVRLLQFPVIRCLGDWVRLVSVTSPRRMAGRSLAKKCTVQLFYATRQTCVVDDNMNDVSNFNVV